MLGGPGRLGQIGLVARRPAVATADFTLSAVSVATQWGPAVQVGVFTPLGTSGEVYFELVDEDAGFAAGNG